MTEHRDDTEREQRPGDEETPADAEKQKPASEGGDPEIDSASAPGSGGYGDRDPKTDMPRVPSSPETQDDE